MCKVSFHLVAVPSEILIVSDTRTRKYHPLTYRQIHTSKDTYRHSFFPYTIPSRLQRTAGVSWSVKLTNEDIWKRVSVYIGSWFYCGIVYGKNECLYVSLEVCICLYVRG
jgi:hypothetical protein